jgi:Protein of unknown function (DUF1569)
VIGLNHPLQELRREIASSTAGMSTEQMRWHLPGKWCAAEILEHLYLTYTGTIKGFQRIIAAGKPLVTPPTWAQRRERMVVLGLGYLPSGREAPPSTRPRGIEFEQVLAQIVPKVIEMEAILAQSKEKFGNGDLLDHPILGPLTAAGWSRFHFVHGRHHLAQIQKLRKEWRVLKKV